MIRNMTPVSAALWIGVALASPPPAVHGDSVAGRWEATVTVRGIAIPFRLDLAGEGKDFTASLFNGDVPVTPSRAGFQNGTLTLAFDQLPMTITAQLEGGQLNGRIQGRSLDRDGSPFHAKRYQPAPPAPDTAPSIAGVWEIPHETVKGEKAWRLIVRQSGAEVAAAILRVDGDTGSLTGRWQDGKFVLSHFDGTRPALMEIEPGKDGSLAIELKTGREGKLTAYRAEEARAKGVPEPEDFAGHTTIKDPSQPFQFRLPDLDGKIRSNEDAEFKGKVVLVNITGTWCPNCHDEAPYLEELYRKYHALGLEIVALDFEEAEQQPHFTRARAFVKKYGIEYPYLVAGAPGELQDKVTQFVNLNTWPATIFIGRDGLVKGIHAGFAGPASGDFYRQLDREYTSTIESLLAQRSQ